VAQGEDPKFKLQYCKKTKKTRIANKEQMARLTEVEDKC
jgi:hypothetical protein